MDPAIFDRLNVDQNVDFIIQCCKDQVNTEMKSHQSLPQFTKYDNAIQFSNEITSGFVKDNLGAVLFIAPTQFGKTATVFWTAHNLLTHTDPKYFVPYSHVFFITGINSNSWKEQTKLRLLPCMRNNVWHNKDIGIKRNIKKLKECVISPHNVLIVIDEVHVGTKINNVIFKRFHDFHPETADRDIDQVELFNYLFEHNVRFIFVSATPDGIKESLVGNWDESKFREIIACPNSAADSYIWHKHYLEADRVKESFRLDTVTSTGNPFHYDLVQRISEFDRPMYHMIRFPMESQHALITRCASLLRDSINQIMGTNSEDVKIVRWDAKHSMSSVCKRLGLTNHSINCPEDILLTKPTKHIIFIVKELFRVAQTMPVDNIGILVDRYTNTPNDSTLSQSLIGRASGHNKSQFIDQIEIYTSVDAVKNYVKLWESNFNYMSVPGYRGYEIKTNKTGTRVTAHKTMLGNQVVRKEAKIKNGKKLESFGDQTDTPERLEKVANAYNKKDTIIYRIIQKFIANDFEELEASEIHKCSVNSSKVAMGHYTAWDTHCRFKVMIMSRKGYYNLNPNVKEHLKL